MLFDDEQTRHEFHQAPLLLQVVTQVFEAHIANYGLQTVLLDSEKRAGVWIALVCTEQEIDPLALVHVVDLVNDSFKRDDELVTCEIESLEQGLVSLRVTDASDFILQH